MSYNFLLPPERQKRSFTVFLGDECNFVDLACIQHSLESKNGSAYLSNMPDFVLKSLKTYFKTDFREGKDIFFSFVPKLWGKGTELKDIVDLPGNYEFVRVDLTLDRKNEDGT